ncbi:hypothetical protein [Pseudomonas protegens]|uniref:hypothetical protein n=1 Tax=Pseudomonas protegens TaxID=380021 RepID=UPI0011AFA456|nr:hypothetical protein [Pseudomonas protegens]
MEAGKTTVTGDQLVRTVRAYCLIDNRWLTEQESSTFRDAVGEAWSGTYYESILNVLGVRRRMAKYGPLLSVFALPFSQSLSKFPEVSRILSEKYGYVLIFHSEDMAGVQLYFVERNAIALDAALSRFANLLHLKNI